MASLLGLIVQHVLMPDVKWLSKRALCISPVGVRTEPQTWSYTRAAGAVQEVTEISRGWDISDVSWIFIRKPEMHHM